MLLIEKVLELLQFQAEVTADLFDSFIGDKSASYRKMRRSFRYGPREFKTDWAEVYRKRQRFYSMLSYLKKEGLVEKKNRGSLSKWKITKEGLIRLKKFKKQRENPYSILNSEYKTPAGSGITIVTFDVPEREWFKRKWLRSCLNSMGFKFLQKSVWLGRGKIPEEFIHDLRERDMLRYVHIFSVSKPGTVREVT